MFLTEVRSSYPFSVFFLAEAMLRLWTVEDRARSAGCAELKSPAEADLTGFISQLFDEQLKVDLIFELLTIS
jgi:hypothetical protein